ncbi:MAG: hypothetical protein WAU45_21615 [Blastocatellia bacterium]
MKRISWNGLGLTMCIVLITLSAFAQNTATPKVQTKKPMAKQGKPMAEAPKAEWFSVAVVRVKPDMVGEWEDLQKNVVNPALKKAGVKERSIFQTAIFGESYEYVVITPIATLSQYDEARSPLRNALGEDTWREYLTKSRRCIQSAHTYGDQTRPDLSYFGKMASMTAPKLAVVNTISVAPGRAAAFESFLKTEILPVMKKADVLGYFVSQTVFGGDVNSYTSVLFQDSFAEIGKGSPLLRVLGAKGLESLGLKYAGLVLHQERAIVRFNPDLSFAATP